MDAAIAMIASYLMGSFPTAYMVGRLRKGVDIRSVGSRNMGAMNVVYQIGLAEGILVLAVDVAKGALAVWLARWLGVSLTLQLLAGAVVVAGHAFPIFLGFRGGKGGASCIGVLGFLMPQAVPFYLTMFVVSLAVSRYPTFSYSLAFLCFPLVGWLTYHSGTLIVYSVLLLVLPGIRYIPRLKEMHSTAGSWQRVLIRTSLKDRF
jgi:glycerol-3-phosphate acyltransferase PlsY